MRGPLVALVIASCAPPPSAPFSAAPRCDGAEYCRLDFWVGEWDVTSPSGAREGTNVIAKTLDGCAIEETWRDADGGRGTSLFYFDRARRTWRQVWVTSNGAWKEKGEVAGPPGAVRFEGEVARASGGKVRDRTTLTPLADGRVHQLIEQSADDGATWRAWEGIYARRKACDAHDFDFWIGEWNVTIKTPKGTARGTNSIRPTLAGCVLEEEFHAEGPEEPWSGRSFSRFADGRWRQTWVDDQGAYLAFDGGLEGSEMILYGEGRRTRMVFTDIRRDALVWRWEKPVDGKWSVAMTIDYVRR